MNNFWNVVVLLLAYVSLIAAQFRIEVRQTTDELEQQEQGLADIADLDLPRCGGLCYVQVFPQYSCELNEPSCLCANANITSEIDACVYSNCTVPEQLSVEFSAKSLCGATFQDDGPLIRRVTWSLFALASFFVGARFLARPQRLNGSGYGVDDWTILLCVVVLIPFNALIEVMTVNGLGTDNFTLTSEEITMFLKIFFIFTILYIILIMITKISILQLYLRIWATDAVSIWFRRFCWLLILIHILTIVAFVLAQIFQCTAVSHAWNFWDGLHDGHCVDRAASLYALGAINICYDVIVFILPLHNFLKLNISWRRKAGVCTIFMVGLLVTICSIIRLQYLVQIGNSPNPTWEYSSAIIWSAVESNLSVICTCMPAMAGLLQRIYAHLSGQPITITSSTSTTRTPLHPKIVDPEIPISRNEMLRMRRPGQEGSVTDSEERVRVFKEGEGDAPTVLREKFEGEGKVVLRHEPPVSPAATRLEYRDQRGRLHEVKVVDRPVEEEKGEGMDREEKERWEAEHKPKDWQSQSSGSGSRSK